MKQRQQRHPVITTCPVCKGDLHVTKLACDACETVIEGQFEFSKFNYLDSDKLYFIEVFIKNRGSIKSIEKELNISYPTVKKMLDDVIVDLGYDVLETDDNFIKETVQLKPKTDILEKLEKGEISVDEALKLMKKGE